jgi:hypothetical protein
VRDWRWSTGSACALEAKTLCSRIPCSQTIVGARKESTSRLMQESWNLQP